MRVIITKDYDEMSRRAADIVEEEIQRNKRKFVLGLATGSTPVGLYRELIRRHKEKGLDFSRVVTFNLDEYIGLAPDHSQSYRYFMDEQLFKHININRRNIHITDGMMKDLEDYCVRYEETIKNAGGIDLQVLGIGSDGHIGFNEPSSSLGSRTRIKTLTEQTIADNARFFDKKEDVPQYAITMGVGTIMEARKCILLASGAKKAGVLAETVEGPITAQVTASALQMHPYAIIISDLDAAFRLKRRAYYEHVERMAQKLKGARESSVF